MPLSSTHSAEYLLIIAPDESSGEKLIQVKNAFAAAYDCPQAAWAKPHISLVKYVHSPQRESDIVRYLKRKVESLAPFSLEIDRFGQFPSHTIFARITTQSAITDALRHIREGAAGLLRYDTQNSPHYITTPHITIARKLLHWQYEKAWLALQHEPFRTAFEVKEFRLLRKTAPFAKYQEVAAFPLAGHANDYTQGCLF